VGFLAEILWRRDGFFFQDVGIEFLHGSSGWPGARRNPRRGRGRSLEKAARPSLRY
jgi:hypothetical protein